MQKNLLFCGHCFLVPFSNDIAKLRKTSAMCAKEPAFLRAMPSERNFGELAPTILKSFFQKKKRQFVVFYLAYS